MDPINQGAGGHPIHQASKKYIGRIRFAKVQKGDLFHQSAKGGPFSLEVEDPYFVSLCAMYASIYICGISTNYLTFSDRVHPVITSLLRYHVYFWVRRFQMYPSMLKKYSRILGAVREHIPTKHVQFQDEPHREGNYGLFDGMVPRTVESDYSVL